MSAYGYLIDALRDADTPAARQLLREAVRKARAYQADAGFSRDFVDGVLRYGPDAMSGPVHAARRASLVDDTLPLYRGLRRDPRNYNRFREGRHYTVRDFHAPKQRGQVYDMSTGKGVWIEDAGPQIAKQYTGYAEESDDVRAMRPTMTSIFAPRPSLTLDFEGAHHHAAPNRITEELEDAIGARIGDVAPAYFGYPTLKTIDGVADVLAYLPPGPDGRARFPVVAIKNVQDVGVPDPQTQYIIDKAHARAPWAVYNPHRFGRVPRETAGVALALGAGSGALGALYPRDDEAL